MHPTKPFTRPVLCSLAVLAMACTTPRAFSDIAMTAQEVGKDVVFKYSGSIDLTGLTAGATMQVKGIVYPVNVLVEFGPNASVLNAADTYDAISTHPGTLGSDVPKFPNSFSGSYFSVGLTLIKVPAGYAGGQIAGTMTFDRTSISGMGINPSGAPYLWTLDNGQKVTLSLLPKVPGNDAKIRTLTKKVKALKRQIAVAKRSKNPAKVRKLSVQLRRITAQIRRLS